MKILTLQQASMLNLKPNEYSLNIGLKGKALKLDFRTRGRGDWIDCYFTCAKGTGGKYKLPVFMRDDGKYAPKSSMINFSSEGLEGNIFIVSSDTVNGRTVWTKAIKIV